MATGRARHLCQDSGSSGPRKLSRTGPSWAGMPGVQTSHLKLSHWDVMHTAPPHTPPPLFRLDKGLYGQGCSLDRGNQETGSRAGPSVSG